jgi:LysR family transcriptional regulator, pca operon transcriptional activator
MLFDGDFVSIMPSLMMAGDLVRGSFQLVPLPIPASVRLAGLIHPPSRALSAPARAFVQALRAFVGDLANRGLADITIGNT